MAENKTINIKINSNTKEATKDTKDYNKAIGSTKKQYDAVLKSGDSYEKQLSDINKIVKETPLNVRDMNKQIQAYQSIALSAGRETPVGQEALKKASELRDRYIDIQNETKRLADDQKNLQGAIQLVGTGVAAFGGVQSAMALSGVESEKLRETMVKLQAAQTLMTSINQIATAVEKESAAILFLKNVRTKALTASTYALSLAQKVTTKGAKLLRVAMISTGIGALVVGIGLLIANFDKLLIPLKGTINAFKAFGDAIGLTNFAEDKRAEEQRKRFEEEKKEREEIIKLLQEEREEIQKQNELQQRYSNARILALQTQKKLAQGNAEEISEIEKKISSEKIAQLKKDQQAFIDDQIKVLGQLEQEVANNAASELRIQQGLSIAGEDFYKKKENSDKKYYELKEQLRTNDFQGVIDIDNQIASIQADETIREKNELKKRQDNYKNYAQERLNAARKIEDLENSLMEDGIEKDLAINEDKFRRLQEDTKKNTKLTAKERAALKDLYDKQELAQQKVINKKYVDLEKEKNAKIDEVNKKANQDRIDKEDALFQLELDLMKDRQMAEIIALSQSYEAKYLLAQDNAELTKQLEAQFLIDQAAIEDKFRKEKADKDKVASDKSKAEAKALEDYKISVVQGGLSAINDIAALFAKGNEKQQKRAFQVQKAVGIAQATINTAQAITKVFAETTDFTPTQSLRIANAVGIGIAGAAQIASIASQQFQGGGGVDSPTDIGGAGGGEAVAPSFNVVGDSGINQIAQLQQQPVQAFVVSGEVTTSQALDRNRVQNATL